MKTIINKYFDRMPNLIPDIQIILQSIPDEPLLTLKLPKKMKLETKNKIKEIFEANREHLEKQFLKSLMIHL
jgi:hypothetical protein